MMKPRTQHARPISALLAHKASLLLRILRSGSGIGRYQAFLSALALPCLPLDLLAELLPPRERRGAPDTPAIFISGYSRSGTTLVYQALARAWNTEYVSNLVMLFPRSFPRMLRLYRGLSSRRSATYENYYGRTLGLYGTNDAPELMRQWFDLDGVTPETIADAVNEKRILHFFKTFSSLFDEPFLMKNCNLHPFFPRLAELLPQARFIFVKRRPENIIDSTLRAREFVQGTRDAAWELSMERQTRPDSDIDPIDEISSNIARCYRNVDAMQRAHPQRTAVVWYEDFCRTPADVMAAMHAQLLSGRPPASATGIPASFRAETGLKTAPSDQEKILARVAMDFPELT